MGMKSRTLMVGVAAAAICAVAAAGVAQGATPERPVPSLQPTATARLWRQLVQRPRTLAAPRAVTVCEAPTGFVATVGSKLIPTGRM